MLNRPAPPRGPRMKSPGLGGKQRRMAQARALACLGPMGCFCSPCPRATPGRGGGGHPWISWAAQGHWGQGLLPRSPTSPQGRAELDRKGSPDRGTQTHDTFPSSLPSLFLLPSFLFSLHLPPPFTSSASSLCSVPISVEFTQCALLIKESFLPFLPP